MGKPIIQVVNSARAKDRGIPTFYCGRGHPPHEWMLHPVDMGNPHDTGDRRIERYKEDWACGKFDEQFITLFEEWRKLGFCKIALACWCIPEDCHAEVIRNILLMRFQNQ